MLEITLFVIHTCTGTVTSCFRSPVFDAVPSNIDDDAEACHEEEVEGDDDDDEREREVSLQ